MQSADYFCSNPAHIHIGRQNEWQLDKQPWSHNLHGGSNETRALTVNKTAHNMTRLVGIVALHTAVSLSL